MLTHMFEISLKGHWMDLPLTHSCLFVFGSLARRAERVIAEKRVSVLGQPQMTRS